MKTGEANASGDPVTRRRFLAGTVAAAGAGTALPLLSAGRPAVVGATIVLHDPRLRLDPAGLAGLQAQGAQVIALSGDPVRQWRDAIAPRLAGTDARLLGVTRWPDYLILRGLAAESRRHVRHESLSVDTGALTWLIA